MASYTLAVPAFPNGTTIGAYPVSRWREDQLPPSGAPLGAATNTQVVANGTVTFTGLTTGIDYFVTDATGSRYMRISPGADTSGSGSVTTADIADGAVTLGKMDPATLGPAAGTMGLRTLGSGALDAAAGNHTHPYVDLGKNWGNSRTACSAPGSNVTAANFRAYLCLIAMESEVDLTGLTYIVGAAAVGNVKMSLWTPDGVTKIGDSASAAQGTINQNQLCPFQVAVNDQAPGLYIVHIIFDTTGASWTGAKNFGPSSQSTAANFNIPSSVTPPSAAASTASHPFVSTY